MKTYEVQVSAKVQEIYIKAHGLDGCSEACKSFGNRSKDWSRKGLRLIVSEADENDLLTIRVDYPDDSELVSFEVLFI